MWYFILYLVIGVFYYKLNMNSKRGYDMEREASFNDFMNRTPPEIRNVVLAVLAISSLIFWFIFFIIDTYEIWSGKKFGASNDK